MPRRVFVGQCKHGCVLADGHKGECKDGNMSDEEYEVEAIVAEKAMSRGRTKFLIKWKNWPDDDNTWEEAHALGDCQEILREWQMRHKRKALEGESSGAKAPRVPAAARVLEKVQAAEPKGGMTATLVAAKAIARNAKSSIARARTTSEDLAEAKAPAAARHDGDVVDRDDEVIEVSSSDAETEPREDTPNETEKYVRVAAVQRLGATRDAQRAQVRVGGPA